MSKGVRKVFGSVQIAAVVLLAVAGVAVLGISNIPGNSLRPSTTVTKPDDHALLAAYYLDIVGVSPGGVAAAGLSPQQAGVVFADLQAYLDGDGAQLQSVIDTWSQANTAADLATRAVRSSKGIRVTP